MVNSSQGGGSKDTWVIDDQPEPYTSLWQQTSSSTTSYVLPSHAAENLFWVGRYAERAEGGIRLVRAIVNNLTDRQKNGDDACRVSLLHALTCTTDTFPGFVGAGADDRLRNPEKEILSVIKDDTRQRSIFPSNNPTIPSRSQPNPRHYPMCSNTAKAYVKTLPIWLSDASHAWFSLYLPNHGWIDFDPTNNLMPDDRHITVAWGRDFADVTPLKGVVLGGGQHALTVSVTVEPIESKFVPA